MSNFPKIDKYALESTHGMASQKTTFAETNINENKLGKLLKIEQESKLVSRLSDIFSILSKNDALVIFLVAKNGLESELGTPQKIELTKKQYYTRLRQLIDLGLIVKNENKYTHTSFGNIVYEKHLMGLLNNMKNSRELEMIDLIKRTSKFKPEEIDQFISKLNPDMNLKSSNDVKNNFEFLSTFETIVERIIGLIESAEKEILLVTRFQNDHIINAVLKKATNKIEVKIITDAKMVENYFRSQKINPKISDKNMKERINVVANPFYPSKVERRYFKAPFCMLLVDQKHIGLEIVDTSEPEKLKTVMFGTSNTSSLQMKEKFEIMWQQSSADLSKKNL